MPTAAALKPVPFLIGGEWVQDTPSRFTHVNPATGEVNYEICAGTEAHIDAAVKSAHEAASKPAWRNMLPHLRAEILHKFADHDRAL
jgi:betaine-aldehyde dehydrogenase